MNINDATTAPYQTMCLDFLSAYTPEQVFAIWANDNWAFWLDSSDGDHIDSRFDIMVFSPEITIKTAQGKNHVHFIAEKTHDTNDQDPFALIDSLIKQTFGTCVPHNQDLPFIGGAIGYFSYDLGRYVESLPEQAKKDINLPDMAVGIYRQSLIFDRKSKQYTLVSFDDNLDTLVDIIKQKLLRKAPQSQDFRLTQDWQANMSKPQYVEKFNQIQQYLLSGDCYQINLAQRFTAQYEGEEYQAYLKLRESNKAPFSAFMRFDEGCVLSVSPERFLQLTQQKVQTKPIKGTRPRSQIAELDKEQAQLLQTSSKDRAENLMIVDLLRNDIAKVCRPGSVVVPSLFAIESFPAVHHLVSTVEGTLDNHYQATDLLRGAFPGGSITGAPKIRAMEIIEELEPHRRSVYCGSIGYISANGNMDSSITIRTLISENQRLHCWAGGGIVSDSKADSEYQETFDKVHKILPTLSS